ADRLVLGGSLGLLDRGHDAGLPRVGVTAGRCLNLLMLVSAAAAAVPTGAAWRRSARRAERSERHPRAAVRTHERARHRARAAVGDAAPAPRPGRTRRGGSLPTARRARRGGG